MLNEKFSLTVNLRNDELEKMQQNHTYWEDNAKLYSSSNEVSWGDANIMKLETDVIRELIPDGSLVLDAGCSNGYSTFNVSHVKSINVDAFDYSAQSIEIAKKEQSIKGTADNITFSTGNILNIAQPSDKFDIAYSIRVIINLPNWDRQKDAILEMHRILKPGGLYLMSEAFSGSLYKLNALRQMANLKPLTVHKFNEYLNENEFEDFVEKYFDIIEIKRFCSSYYVASRFLRYLIMDKDEPDTFKNEVNDFFSKFTETNQSGDFGIQKLYVLKKKEIS